MCNTKFKYKIGKWIGLSPRYNYGKPQKREDELKDVILELLSQSTSRDSFVTERAQPFIREFCLRHGNQPSMVSYLNQTLEDMRRFCTCRTPTKSPFIVDTTFNICDYYFTQTAYMNLSVVLKHTGKHPWFPGPLLVHRSKKQEVFQYFWQSVKRDCPALEDLAILGTDEDEGMANGILSETSGTIHLLGQEHVRLNIERKLDEFDFPSAAKRRVVSDIFGGAAVSEGESLYGSSNAEEFDVKVKRMKKEWDELERTSTRNSPPKFVRYFETYKEIKIKNCMSKYIRDQAGIDGVYGQNPIEWLHFMSKTEINEAVRKSGETYRDTSLTAALDALKGRNIRLYSDVVKAVYGEGPYKISDPFKRFCKTYDEWKDMSKDEKTEHVQTFLTANPQNRSVPRTKKVVRSTNPTKMARSNATDQSNTADQSNAPDDEISTARKLSISAEEACIPEECVRLSTLQDIFRKAEFLLNAPGAITQAASNDARMRTVKSRSGGIPLIVQPQKKSSNLFNCQCSTFRGLGVCADTVAVAESQGLLFEYLTELRTKLGKNKAKPRRKGQGDVNITAAIETGLKISEIGKILFFRNIVSLKK